MNFENVIIVTAKTRLEQLVEQFNTKSQAQFYIEHAGGNFTEYIAEHDAIKRSLDEVVRLAGAEAKIKVIDRKFLPTFLFSPHDIVVALGQDGLVANTAKYIEGQPLMGVNPDPERNDGILLPFSTDTFLASLREVINNKYKSKSVTMAKAMTNDGQSLLAFNDLFIGPATHTSARYKITYASTSEEQSSSGLIVSTGAGSTGWLSSLANMSYGMYTSFNKKAPRIDVKMKWEEDRLAFMVREPFLSKHSSVDVTGGFVTRQKRLVIESHMPFQGVIFSDGIESDFIKFNSGCSVEISIAERKANMVQA